MKHQLQFIKKMIISCIPKLSTYADIPNLTFVKAR